MKKLKITKMKTESLIWALVCLFYGFAGRCHLYWEKDSGFLSFQCWLVWVPIVEILAKDLHSSIFWVKLLRHSETFLL